MKLSFTRSLFVTFLLCVCLCVCVSGCQQRTVGKLQGRWEGRPDTAATRAAREAEKYGDEPAVSVEQGSGSKTNETVQVTDWEDYDVTVVLDFVSSERLEMSLDGEQTLSGSWKIIATSPAGCSIEVQTESESKDGEELSAVRRRFELLLDERDGICVGFLLTEAGADRQLGSLHFQRPESVRVARSD